MISLSTSKTRASLLLAMLLQCLFIGRSLALEAMVKPAELVFQDDKIKVAGKVTAVDVPDGLPGVSVYVDGTTIGTITDVNGDYSIEAPSSAVLIFSYVGYITERTPIANQSAINVDLTPDITALEEVVVVGYGAVKKKELTGAVVSMNAEKIKETNKVNAVQALQGQVSGVDIQAAGNKPGEPFNIRIRGASTINSNESIGNGGYSAGQNPLFVVDGIFVNDITFLNPADIERIDVLKDASSTAIYGSRGTNGVVIITTKRGDLDTKLNIKYDAYHGIRQPYNFPRIFEGEEFVDFFTDAVVGVENSGGNTSFTRDDVVLADFLRPNEIENINNGNYVDWVDLIKQNGIQSNHTLNLSGGSSKTAYNFSLGYTKDEGTFPGENLDRYNLSGSIQSDLSDKLTLSFSNYVTYQVRDEGSREGFRSAYRLRPTGSVFEDNGELRFFPLEAETFITNPLFEEDNITRETQSINYVGNISVTLRLLDNLEVTSSFSPNIDFSRYGEYRGLLSKSVSDRPERRRAQVDHANRLAYTWDNIINYRLNLSNEHALKATFITSTFLDRIEDYQNQVRDFDTDEFLFHNIDAGSDIRQLRSNLQKQTLQSFTGRLGYTFRDKYLFTLTGRYDGASILSEGNKWAFFPSAAFAWRVIDEGFMADQGIFTDLKLRLSYGETGNNGTGGGLAPLQSQSLLDFQFTNLGDQPQAAVGFSNLANQDLKWERTREVNIGLDFGLLKNRLYGSVDFYNRNSVDVIFQRSLPRVTGFSGVFDNIGEVRNRGIELGINSINVDAGAFKWTTSINFARNQNEIIKLIDEVDELRFTVREAELIHRVGEEVGSIFYYEFDGIWQEDEADEAERFGQRPGQVKVKDIDDNGQITGDDRTILGSALPDWTGGMTNVFNYKGLDFSIFVTTRQGVTEYSWFHRSHGWDADDDPARFNGLKTNYWTPDNPSNEWWQPGNAGPWKRAMFYRDVSFVKIGYMTLGYTIPSELTEKLKLGSLRVYFTAHNPFIFTDYEGWDPETASRNSWGSAFLARTLIGGVNVSF